MGLFSWLFGKPSRVTTRDVIWLTEAARGDGITKAVDEHLLAGKSVLLLAQFPATLAAFGTHILAKKWAHIAVPNVLTPDTALALAAESAPRLLYGLARNLRPAEFLPPDDAPASRLPILVLERHPLRIHDDRIVEFATGLGGRAAIEFYISFDDPLLKRFAGDWARDMLRRLGMKEDEPIESAMVARRLGAAQRKVAKGVTNEVEAESAEDWLIRNSAGDA